MFLSESGDIKGFFWRIIGNSNELKIPFQGYKIYLKY